MRLQKETKLANGNKLLAFWANNAGRGRDNCTLIVVPGHVERKQKSAQHDDDLISWTRTGSWGGDVNLSKAVCARLRIKKTDLMV